KCFQIDPEFSLIAFSHHCIKSSTTGSHILTHDQQFPEIRDCLLSIDPETLGNLAEKLKTESIAYPNSEDEKNCYHLLKDLGLLAWYADGPNTNKKFQCSEINALCDHWGSPSWYITVSPSDTKHPICIYLADNDNNHAYTPNLHSLTECSKLVINNPVAHAQFFDFFIQLFLKEIIGIDSVTEGWFGKPAAFYATVEQQG
ncbi:hypothetical protein BDP27DRAFT_1152937, partial [Rhodocollybia butyracea]